MNALRWAGASLLTLLVVLFTPRLSLTCAAQTAPKNGARQSARWAIAIHGGAGESEWEHMDAATAAAYHASLEKALEAGAAVLKRHG
ncbi:MAG TPA: hypothetical protein VN151_00720, partial [Terracidiphilus sp.]|nr:hypothetical protein [Terracidiphilus sp.]